MQPSSLVFLVIIAVWAAYFVQYWVRRREHLATARSVDQFSESMRVLERRSPLPASDLSSAQPRSYAVTPARVARPQVLVKRAVNTPSTPVPPAADSMTSAATPDLPPSVPARPRSTARRTRAVVMLGALATVLVVTPLVALALLPLYVVAVPVLAVGAALTWSRSTVQAERRARLAARRAARPVRPAPSAQVEVATAEPSGSAHPEPGESRPAATATARDELYDVQAVETGLRQPAAASPATAQPAVARSAEPVVEAPVLPARPLVDEDDIPLTWDPVPVPRPTYTMKARVTRPAPTAADLVGDADTEYADGEHTAYAETAERRAAGA